MTPVAVVIWLAGAAVLGAIIPAAFVAALAPKLAETPAAQRTNYRGRVVFLGLGIVWLVWAGCAIIAGAVVGSVSTEGSTPFAAGLLLIAGPLALVAFSLGMVDDAFGSGADRGFKGHIRALLGGRLTTGMLKLIGISLASLVCAAVISEVAPWGAVSPGGWSVLRIGAVLVAGASIALTSNLLNLVDLRPGRALKVYSLLAVVGAVLAGLSVRSVAAAGAPWTMASGALAVLTLAVFALGPVVAVWRFDLGELGMLGDAGANPMGAVAGLLIVAGLPPWGLVMYAATVFVLNLASERVSFSRVIDSTPPLRALDRLGRLPEDALVQENSTDTSAGAPRVGGEG